MDGVRVPILRANVAFSPVAVGTGRHAVLLRYRPNALLLGALLSLLGWLILAGVLLVAMGVHSTRKNTDTATMGAMLGFAVMMTLDVALG